MSKTIAQHSADYRARRTAKLQRYEEALRKIGEIAPYPLETCAPSEILVNGLVGIARTALGIDGDKA